MNWTQIKVTCGSGDLDRVTAIMGMIDSRLMIEDFSDIDTGLDTIYGTLIDEDLLNADRTHSSVSLYLEDSKSPGDAKAFITERLNSAGIDFSLNISSVGDEDWENSWKKYYKPFTIGRHIAIVPAWEKYDPKPDDVVITMDPGLAFGAGTHETTRLCTSLIEDCLKKGMKVLDVGTGSGILAICAAKLGAGSVSACDIDPIAVRVAKENCEANGVPEVSCFESDLLDAVTGTYDFISANIVADIIIRMAPGLERVTRFGSLVAVSGVIDEYAKDVIDAMDECGFGLSDIRSDNGWKGMLFTRVR